MHSGGGHRYGDGHGLGHRHGHGCGRGGVEPEQMVAPWERCQAPRRSQAPCPLGRSAMGGVRTIETDSVTVAVADSVTVTDSDSVTSVSDSRSNQGQRQRTAFSGCRDRAACRPDCDPLVRKTPNADSRAPGISPRHRDATVPLLLTPHPLLLLCVFVPLCFFLGVLVPWW
jgi:hypothetical protein